MWKIKLHLHHTIVNLFFKNMTTQCEFVSALASLFLVIIVTYMQLQHYFCFSEQNWDFILLCEFIFMQVNINTLCKYLYFKIVLSCKCKFIFTIVTLHLLSVTLNLALVTIFLVNVAVFHNCDHFVQLQVYFLIIVTSVGCNALLSNALL